MKVSVASAAVLGLALLAAGCGTATTKTASNNSAPPAKNATINFALPPQTSVDWYFPLINSADDSLYNSQVYDQMYMPLLYIDKNYGIDWSVSIAKKVVWNKSGTVYHVYMNPKWVWSNGHPVTTKDILFDWAVIKATSAPNAPAPWPYVGAGTGDIPSGIQSLVANGKYEFTVTLKKPANQLWFEYDGLNQLEPLPASVWNRYPTNITKEITWLGKNATKSSLDSVVDGPYKLVKAVPSQYWRLAPNPKFAGHKALDTLNFDYETSNDAEFVALRSGTVQIGYVDPSQYAAIGSLKQDVIWNGYPFDYQDIELNMNKNAEGGLGPVFSHLYVRKALEMAIPQSTIDTSVYHNVAPPQYGPIPTVPATKYLAPQLKKPLYPYNLKAAKALLTSHGWVEKNGVMTKNGQSLSFPLLYAGGTASTTDQLVLIQSDWAKIGVKVSLHGEPFSTLIGVIDNNAKSPDWDAAGGQGIIYGGSYPSGGELFEAGGGLNNFGWNNSQENALIKATHTPQPSNSALMNTFFDYEVYTAKMLPNLWVNQVGTINAVEKNMVGVNSSTLNEVTGTPLPEYWYVKK